MVILVLIGMAIAGTIHYRIVREREEREELEANMRLLKATFAHFGRPFDPPAPKVTHWTQMYTNRVYVGRPLAFV